MAEGHKKRVLIVGAGIVGASIAYEIDKQRTNDVIVLEAGERPCSGATGSSWAWINANQKNPKWYQEMNHQGMLAWTEGIYGRFLSKAGAIVYEAQAAR